MDSESPKCENCGREMYVEHGGTYCLKCHFPRMPGQETELTATRESNFAPLWLIFPNDIINTARITRITNDDHMIIIYMDDRSKTEIPVKDLNTTWKALQTVFAEGVAKKS